MQHKKINFPYDLTTFNYGTKIERNWISI